MSARRIEIFVIVVIIALFGIVYGFTKQPVKAPTVNNSTQQVASSVVEYQGQDGKTALDLLKAGHIVELKSYSYGDMVTAIDRVIPDTDHFWAMYVNGEFSQVGASYVTKSSDQIKWMIERIEY